MKHRVTSQAATMKFTNPLPQFKSKYVYTCECTRTSVSKNVEFWKGTLLLVIKFSIITTHAQSRLNLTICYLSQEETKRKKKKTRPFFNRLRSLCNPFETDHYKTICAKLAIYVSIYVI